MKLDRSRVGSSGKYAAINMRKVLRGLEPLAFYDVKLAIDMLKKHGVFIDSAAGEPEEFFLIKLKDKYAPAALRAYSDAAEMEDPEYSREVLLLADRSSQHPLRKAPD